MAARKKSGFTLIELLVVIAIIAILAAILFPVFARAREAARKSTCQSNMKECAIALQTYWNDYDATLPASYQAGSGTVNDAGANDNGFVIFGSKLGVIPPGINGDPGVPNANNGNSVCPVTWSQMLYNAHKGKDILFCPSDSAEHSPTIANAYNTTVSYWWKFAIDKAWRSLALKCQKEGDFGYNADQVIFYERAGFHSGAAAGTKNDVQITCAFLDTHVKSVSLVNSSQPANSATYVNDPKANGEPAYFNFDNTLPKSTTTAPLNPPAVDTAVTNIDPRRYSDMMP